MRPPPCNYPDESNPDLCIKKGCGISWINKGQKFGKLINASTFYLSVQLNGWRFDLKEKHNV